MHQLIGNDLVQIFFAIWSLICIIFEINPCRVSKCPKQSETGTQEGHGPILVAKLQNFTVLDQTCFLISNFENLFNVEKKFYSFHKNEMGHRTRDWLTL